MVTRTSTVDSPASGRGPVSPAGSTGASAGASPRPRKPCGYHVSSTWPPAVTVARPTPQAGEVVSAFSTARTLLKSARDLNREGGSPSAGMVRPMANPLTPEVLVDPVALTRALVD